MSQKEDFDGEATRAAERSLDIFIGETGRRPERGKGLYHYTNAAGLLGILKTNTIRGTDARFMNDPLELNHGFRVITEYCDGDFGKSYPTTSQLLKEAFHLNKLFGNKTAYIASLSEEDDQLSQWRAYAEDGAGYSIGFDPYKHLVALHENAAEKKAGLEALYLKVLYEEDKQRHLFEQVVSPIAEVLERCGMGFFRRSRGPAFELLDIPVSLVIAAMKQKGFHEEREWRLVMPWRTRGCKLEFRPSSKGVVPYVEFTSYHEPKLPIVDVVVGPRLGEGATSATVRALKKYGHHNTIEHPPGMKKPDEVKPGIVYVRPSGIQYR